jgi:hypothetical protein
VTLTNTGFGPLSMGAITFTRADYTQSNNCGASIDPAASCTINVIFTPVNTGNRNATMTINDGAGTQSVALTGTGVAPAASRSPGSLAFGNLGVGVASTSQVVTLANTGIGPLSIGTITFTRADYTQSNNCGTSIGTGTSCTINVVFTPSSAGNRNGTMTINDGAGSQTVSLTGAGVTMSASPNPLTFGPVATSAVVKTVTVTTAALPVTLTNIAISNGSGRYSVVSGGTCAVGATVPANSSCTINVSLSVGGEGGNANPTGNLRIVDAAGQVNVALQR